MVGLIVVAARMAVSVRRAWADPAFRGAVVTLLTLVITATAFYALHEGWSVIDSLYFSVTTGLTIGYGDLVPTTTASKIFTMLYAVSAVGLFVALGSLLARATMAGHDKRASRRALRRQRRTGPPGAG
ncbi:potassium channel family protein [Streptomyces sp. ACA25]|uniref:potassium channel family protein n=1 Tax=Streptomyces sp. ACA25 TaxID=3022596 RepID=UPI00230821A1|nr:potassium channel family protein [Streptomyces sp. ACA25]MDB1087393.1 potassium channel family protein [Streptomyces sp. ACA25]